MSNALVPVGEAFEKGDWQTIRNGKVRKVGLEVDGKMQKLKSEEDRLVERAKEVQGELDELRMSETDLRVHQFHARRRLWMFAFCIAICIGSAWWRGGYSRQKSR